MKIGRTMTLSLCAAGLLAGAALAQPHGFAGKGMVEMVDHFATALDLTAEQKATATQLAQALQAKAAPLIQQSRRQEAEIEALLESANPDATQVGEKVIAAHATRTQLTALHREFHDQLTAGLTAGQKTKLEQMMKQHHEMDGPGPPGHGF